MPLAPSAYASVPSFVNQGADLTQMGQGGRPGGAPISDLFVQVAVLSMRNPEVRAFLSGIGALEVFRELQKAGRGSATKAHRSNQELQGRGVPVGAVGQTGLPTVGGMVRTLQPPAVPGLGPASTLGAMRI